MIQIHVWMRRQPPGEIEVPGRPVVQQREARVRERRRKRRRGREKREAEGYGTNTLRNFQSRQIAVQITLHDCLSYKQVTHYKTFDLEESPTITGADLMNPNERQEAVVTGNSLYFVASRGQKQASGRPSSRGRARGDPSREAVARGKPSWRSQGERR